MMVNFDNNDIKVIDTLYNKFYLVDIAINYQSKLFFIYKLANLYVKTPKK